MKKSTLPGAGKGLFTLEDIGRDEIVVEYQGEEIDWQEYKERVEKDQDGYLFFINWKKCIDAFHTPGALGRYANDARGFSRMKGCRNNAVYKVIRGRVYIVSTRRIRAGEEVFVDYSADYWKAMRHNRKIASPA
ncbi:SET domain-containing protein [Kamptonema cortianum]|nr:SET domain-containing protein [Kamptonema cortianum]MDL5053393.1 SET domain-containing protein [Oscillatoria laete-virens NRMC-F 0139]